MSDDSVEDEGSADFLLKRKLTSKEEPEPKRQQQSPKGLKPREGAFSALPSKKAGSIAFKINQAHGSKKTESNPENKGSSINSSSGTQNGEKESYIINKEEASSPMSCLNDSADSRPQGDGSQLLPAMSSPEMAVNGA